MKLPKCLKCSSFAWWDGDYVCVAKFKILNDVHNEHMFDDNLIKTIKKCQENCDEFKPSSNKLMLDMYKEEYRKWKELYDLKMQLFKHNK